MRILMLAPHIDALSSRGGAIHQTELLAALQKNIRVDAVFQKAAEGGMSLGAKPQPLLTLITLLKAYPYAKRFDIIHDRGYLLGGAGVLAGKIRGVPTVLQVDDNWIEGDKASGHWIWKLPLYEKLARFWIRNFVKRADAVVVVSGALKGVAVKEWGANPRKVFVVGNGVNLAKFDPRAKPMRNELGINKGSKVLTFVGEMAPWHGILETVKAAEIVVKARKGCVFLFAGGVKTHERYLRQVQQYVASKGLERRIRFIGKIPYEKVPCLLASSDVLLAPYTQPKGINFGFSPLKLFEYMAMKKPIITSDLPWIREIITEHEACFLRDPKDSKEFSERMLRLLGDKKYAGSIAAESRKLAVAKHSWEKVAGRLEAIYKEVLDKKKAAE